MLQMRRFGCVCLFVIVLSMSFVASAFSEEAQTSGSSSPTAQAATSQKSLYERLGGGSAIQAVVDDFVDRAIASPRINFTRQGKTRAWQATPENVALLKKRMVQFISVSAGAADVIYEGKDMKTAHEGMQINIAEFIASIVELKASLDKFNIPAQEQKELLDIVGAARSTIVEQRKASESA